MELIDYAIKDLEMISDCRTCGNKNSFCETNPDSCSGYTWRGAPPQAQLEPEGEDQPKLWCYWQNEDADGIYCTASCAEGRTFNCPYKDLDERKNALYPCSDYQPREEEQS